MTYPGSSPSRIEPGSGITRINYLLGSDPKVWQQDVPAYSSLVYRGIYPNIDMAYDTAGRQFKSEFIVHPGGDPACIRIAYAGITDAYLNASGDLNLVTTAGDVVREEIPAIYQEIDGERTKIPGGFRLTGKHEVGFEVGPYDPSRPLVIDPVLSYSTYLGGSGVDVATAAAADASGNLYVAGWTVSAAFPTKSALRAKPAGIDAFLVKLNAAGSMVYGTLIGGRGEDRAHGVAVDGGGNVYLAGSTRSSDFPSVLALQRSLAGDRDAFLVKLNSAGSKIVYSTFLGGRGSDAANALAIDGSGAIYMAGETSSPDFPVRNALQSSFRGRREGFLCKLTPSGGAFSYATYLGGEGDDWVASLAVDSAGNAFVAGGTGSADFPVVNAAYPNRQGLQDAFVARLSASGASLLFSTYLGGRDEAPQPGEAATALALDSSSNVFVTGHTSASDFPTLQAWQNRSRGGGDAFLTKLAPSGTLLFSTFLGGSSLDAANGIRVDSSGTVFIVGYTASADFPTASPFQARNTGLYDGFLVQTAPGGDQLAASSYLGGSGMDALHAVTADPGGNIYLAGQTQSPDFPVAASLQPLHPGAVSAIVVKLGKANAPPSAVSATPASGAHRSQIFRLLATDPNGAGDLARIEFLVNDSPVASAACKVRYDPALRNAWLSNDAATAELGPLVLGKSGSLQNSQCVLEGPASFAQTAGDSLVVSLSLSFKSSFHGSKNLYLIAVDKAGQSTGWQQRGVWTLSPVVSMPNPGFDSGAMAPWSPYGTVSASVTTAANFTSAHSLRETLGSGGVFQDIGGLVAGRTYLITARTRSTPGTIGQAILWAHDAAGAQLTSDGPRLPSPDSWDQFAIHFVASATGKVRIHLHYTGGAGSIYWDDIHMIGPAGAPALLNAGFENGPSGWFGYGSLATRAVTGAEAHQGAFSLLQITGQTGGGGIAQDLPGLSPGKTYLVSVWVRAEPGATSTALLWLHDTREASIASAAVIPTPHWQRIETLFTATATGVVRVHLHLFAGIGSVFFDDVAIE